MKFHEMIIYWNKNKFKRCKPLKKIIKMVNNSLDLKDKMIELFSKKKIVIKKKMKASKALNK